MLTIQMFTLILDVLPKLINDYNKSKHRTIKISPTEASDKRNESEVWHSLHSGIKPISINKAKLELGDKVCKSKFKINFEKGYTTNWTEEVFIIDGIQFTNPIT